MRGRRLRPVMPAIHLAGSPGNKSSMHPANDMTPGNKATAILVACILIGLSTSLSPPLARVLDPQLWAGLGISQRQWSVASAVGAILLVGFILMAGVLADLYGRRRMLLLALGAHLAGLALCLLTGQGLVSSGILVALGVTGTMIHTLTLTLLVVTFTDSRRIIAVTTYAIAHLLSAAAGSVVDAWLVEIDATFLLFALPLVLGIGGFILAARLVKESRSDVRSRVLNVVAIALWAGAICAILFGVLLLLSLGIASPLAWGFGLLGGVALILLNWLERNPPRPDLRFTLNRERPLAAGIVTGVVVMLIILAVTSTLYYYFRDIQDRPFLTAVLRLSPLLIGGLLASAGAMRFTRRRGPAGAVILSLVLLSAATLMLTIVRPTIPYWLLAPMLVLLGGAWVLGNSGRVLLLSKSVPYRLDATIQSIGVATSQLGAATAYVMMLNLINLFAGRAYRNALIAAGLSQEAIAQSMDLLHATEKTIEGAVRPEAAVAALSQTLPGYELAYSMGLSQALFFLTLVSLGTALAVYLLLERSPMGSEDKTPPPAGSEPA